jgi:hypothetical protein
MANELKKITPYYWRYWNTNIIANSGKFTALGIDHETIKDACKYVRKAVKAIRKSIK